MSQLKTVRITQILVCSILKLSQLAFLTLVRTVDRPNIFAFTVFGERSRRVCLCMCCRGGSLFQRRREYDREMEADIKDRLAEQDEIQEVIFHFTRLLTGPNSRV